jgi:PAS domain S-box-containing protein
MDADRSFLYGVVALQSALIDSQQFSEFIEACMAWDAHRDGPLTDVLVTRGWIQSTDRAHLDYLVERKLQQHAGDAKAGLASVTSEVERSLASLRSDKIQRSLPASPKPEGSLSATPGVDPVSQNQDRYALTSLHATGGIGRVWLARDGQMGRDVALKELRPEQADNAVLRARFLREAQITGQLEHPGIVPVYELARRPDTGQPFYTMRFVKGRTLNDAARAHHQKRAAGQADSLEFSTLLNAFVVVCKTVAYAHSRGVIHRDLKGQNVIVGDFGEVVVLDWGLAKLVGRIEEEDQTPAVSMDHHSAGKVDLTMQGDTLGTPAYMAPEQAAGRLGLIDRRTDVYGLGAMLYHLLTGQSPFGGANVAEVLRKVELENPIPPEQLWAEVPPTLQAACLRALAKQPSARFASASDLAHEVEQWQEVQRKEAEEALRASQALYHSLVESIPLWVWRKDLDSRFTFANQGFSEAMGLEPENMIGKSDHDFFPAALADRIRRDDAHVLKTGETLRVTEERTVTDKGPRLVEVIKIPIRDSRGEIVGTQGILWDMTAWKRTEEESRPRQEPS